MNIKSKKPAFIDEVSNYLSFIEEINSTDKEIKQKLNSEYSGSFNNIQLGNFEKDVNHYLKKNYIILPYDLLKDRISRLNNVQLLPEEKFKILNFKPKTEIELSLLVDNLDEKLTKEDIEVILKIFNVNKK